jgi:hypothetical protein
MKRLRLCLTLTLALLLITTSVASAGRNANPGVLPPEARVQGLTLGEWDAKEWQAITAIPASQNPVAGAPWTDCYVERIGNVGLGIAFFEETGTFACEMPPGTVLFQPIVGVFCSNLFGDGETEEELRACAMSYVPEDVQASVDGVPVQNLGDYLFITPLVEFTLPDDNIFGLPPGEGIAVLHDTAFLLAPLSPGQHTLHLQGSFPEFDFYYDWVFEITVTNER